MGNITFDINNQPVKANMKIKDNPFDIVRINFNKAVGSLTVPPYIILNKNRVPSAHGLIQSVMPLSVKCEEDAEWYTFPVEPLVEVKSKNVITKRTVAKYTGGGTIKESWTRDDYEVTITGVIRSDEYDQFPENEFKTLTRMFEQRKSVFVEQDMLLMLGINALAIEEIEFPSTPGLENQQFKIKAWSDNSFDLLMEL